LMEGECLQIRIEDTGICIAAADIPKALSPFGQIDSALSRRHTGTGLGLPLTKRLVEAHGALLEIQSEIGVGTVAIVEFPASRLAPVQPYLQASA
jgi:signal transduction histidine kinase